MRRILLLATVAVMMAAMMAAAGPASATIHSIACADNAESGTPGAGQNPPGISDDDEDAVVDNGTNAEERQPVTSVQGNPEANEHARNKDCGPS